MTYTETVDLTEELERLREQKRELADKAAECDPESDMSARLYEQGTLVDKRIRGVKWARDHAHTDSALPTRDGTGRPCPVWDEDVDELVFQSVQAELPLIEDEVGSKAHALDLKSTAGMSRLRTIAYGTARAPYHDPDVDVDARVAAISELPSEFRRWAESVIVGISTLGNGNETSFAAAVHERRTEAQQDEETDTPTPSAQ